MEADDWASQCAGLALDAGRVSLPLDERSVRDGVEALPDGVTCAGVGGGAKGCHENGDLVLGGCFCLHSSFAFPRVCSSLLVWLFTCCIMAFHSCRSVPHCSNRGVALHGSSCLYKGIG